MIKRFVVMFIITAIMCRHSQPQLKTLKVLAKSKHAKLKYHIESPESSNHRKMIDYPASRPFLSLARYWHPLEKDFARISSTFVEHALNCMR